LGIVNSGNGTGSSVGTGQFPNVPFTPVAPVTRYFPLNTLSPTIFLTPPVLIHPVPALPTCFLVDIRAVATKYQGLGIDQPLGGYACALTNDDYTSAAGPNDTRSAGNFHQLAALARGGSFTLAVTAVRQESAATLRVSTKITVAGTSGSTVGCRSTTFVLNGGTNAGYTISSVGPPLAVRCG
ncbi:MAG TPA: hypothetical protein VH352_19820, partial [Pseudonocardiaceae bacterium]|nr:hypothetical protein [Pseudonocardiaceae bacterium]